MVNISAHTYITNPLTSGYLIYLPAIQSFLDIADEVIVVDGGSSDGSLERLSTLRGSEKLKVVYSDQTYWGHGDGWERPQFGIQRQTGFEMCQGDWVISFDADHVLPDFEKESLLRQLNERRNEGILYGFKLIECTKGRCKKIKKVKKWCINKKLMQKNNVKMGYGIYGKTGGNEEPVWMEEKRFFTDPIKGIKKYYFAGEKYPMTGILDIHLYKYDHFFFSSQQLYEKVQRFENMRARWADRPPVKLRFEERPYRLIDPELFLKKHRHPKAMEAFLRSFVSNRFKNELDIVGLRWYPESWPEKLFWKISNIFSAYS